MQAEQFFIESGGTTRRAFLLDGASMVAAGSVAGRLVRGGWLARSTGFTQSRASQLAALRALGRSVMRQPNSLPNPSLPAGTDTIPQIEHIVVLMLENHSYDNLFGMLGRRPGERRRGDGFALALDGYPKATNPYPNGKPLRAFRMPTTCQLHGKPSQEWKASHVQYANGKLDGFVISDSGPVAMGYWQREDLPLTYDLATHFPIGDRWFCSALAQTDPNRRFLIAGTSSGMTDDIGTSIGNIVPDALLGAPTNGTIFERLSDAHVSWIDYNASFPTGTTMELYPSADGQYSETNAKPIAQFFSDAKAGTLPSFSLLDPDYGTQSQEDPQNIVVGEAFLAQVVDALRDSPAWLKTMLILTYDEHGGYYDHVPPPPALAPDSIPPVVQPSESTYDGFARYGFRVPSIVVSPYAKRDYVSHAVYDHTSILAMVERKWNLAAMTYRDANANDLSDFLDLDAMASGQPTFPELPELAAPGENAATLACSKTGAGTIPPPPPGPPRLKLRSLGIRRHTHGLVLQLRTTHGAILDLNVQLYRAGRRVSARHVAKVSALEHRLVLRDHGHAPAPGHYTVVVRKHGRTLLRRRIRIH